MTVFLFFPENRIQYFKQTVSIADNLHEISKSVFLEKYFKMPSAENLTPRELSDKAPSKIVADDSLIIFIIFQRK